MALPAAQYEVKREKEEDFKSNEKVGELVEEIFDDSSNT